MIHLLLGPLLALCQAPLEVVPTELAPLAKQVASLAKHAAVSTLSAKAWTNAQKAADAEALQEALDAQAVLEVRINPEGRVKLARGLGSTSLQAGKPTPLLVKVVNGSGGQQRLKPLLQCPGLANSPIQAAWFQGAPGLGQDLNGHLVEYRLLLLTASKPGLFEVVFSMEAGQGTQDLGFRGETPLLLRVKP